MEELKKQLEEATAKIKESEAKVAELTGSVTTLTKEVKEKNVLIEQKNQDLVGLRKQSETKYKKLADMTEAEKEAMSQKEIELQQRQEKFEADQAKLEKTIAEQNTKERNYRIDSVVKKIAGKDAKLAEIVRANMDRIKDSDKATTPEELEKIATEALGMTGQARPNPVRGAINATGEVDVAPDTKGFADSDEGKSLAAGLNLKSAQAQPAGKVVTTTK